MQALKYIERITSAHDGPAWVAMVDFSSSGKTLYFNNRAFKTWDGRGIGGNYFDIENDDTYWITNPKKNGSDRHKHGRGIVLVQSSIVDNYLEYLGINELDEKRFKITSDIKNTNKERFHKLENQIVTGGKRTEKEIRTKKRRH